MSRPSKCTAIALFDFEPITSQHIPLKRGQFVEIILADSRWWKVSLIDDPKIVGLVPCNYIQITVTDFSPPPTEPLPTPSPSPPPEDEVAAKIPRMMTETQWLSTRAIVYAGSQSGSSGAQLTTDSNTSSSTSEGSVVSEPTITALKTEPKPSELVSSPSSTRPPPPLHPPRLKPRIGISSEASRPIDNLSVVSAPALPKSLPPVIRSANSPKIKELSPDRKLGTGTKREKPSATMLESDLISLDPSLEHRVKKTEKKPAKIRKETNVQSARKSHSKRGVADNEVDLPTGTSEHPEWTSRDNEFGKKDTETTVRFSKSEKGVTIAGISLPKLIEKTIVHADKIDNSKVCALLNGYKAYATILEMISLFYKYYMFCKTLDADKKKDQLMLGNYFFLREWVTSFFTDFVYENQRKKILEVIEFSTSTVPQTHRLDLKAILLQKIAERKSFRIIPFTKDVAGLLFMNIPTADFAKQLTLIEYEAYQKISPVECFKLGWAKKKNAPALKGLAEFFNRFVGWLNCQILSFLSVKSRKAIIEKCVDLADELFALKNYNGMNMVISSLQSRYIFRLKKSWRDKYIAKCLHHSRLLEFNYKGMRSLLSKTTPPCVPYVGMFLTDLTFIEDGNPDYLDEDPKMINYSKLNMLWNTVHQMLAFQKASFSFEVKPHIRNFVMSLAPNRTEEEQYERSLFLEPRQDDYY